MPLLRIALITCPPCLRAAPGCGGGRGSLDGVANQLAANAHRRARAPTASALVRCGEGGHAAGGLAAARNVCCSRRYRAFAAAAQLSPPRAHVLLSCEQEKRAARDNKLARASARLCTARHILALSCGSYGAENLDRRRHILTRIALAHVSPRRRKQLAPLPLIKRRRIVCVDELGGGAGGGARTANRTAALRNNEYLCGNMATAKARRISRENRVSADKHKASETRHQRGIIRRRNR